MISLVQNIEIYKNKQILEALKFLILEVNIRKIYFKNTILHLTETFIYK